MSAWGSLEAEFRGESSFISVESVSANLPTGSEDGPTVREIDGGVVVDGRLRDVHDEVDSPAVLAWFVSNAQWCDSASLLWDLDREAKYRYRYTRENGIEKLRGILD